MRTPDELKRAINHMVEAKRGLESKGDDVGAAMLSRMIDMAHWWQGQPSEFEEWMRKWDRMDKLAGKRISN